MHSEIPRIISGCSAHDDHGQDAGDELHGRRFLPKLRRRAEAPVLCRKGWLISAFDAPGPAQLLDPARAIKTRWAIDRQPRQLQQHAAIARTLSGCFCGVQRAPSRSRTGTAWRLASLGVQNTVPISQSSICHAPAMTALRDTHGILDAAQNLQHDVGAARTWTGTAV